ncbi:DUF1272 domain-containing protein [Stutzerimonas azotifigens]|uniref:DUF1272 domain-containing protein n=1 Tax=Stutzerimonas azotifigens TaxID=291995 RepID=A0ABR5Z1T3_9GAMM|nr:DUF1272 domain-containing protein [Stutzerimonas azotifigens]MBA1274154.1 DUF1272 domain-containing protein [Stutzerimonas azotifigens]
MLEVRPNCEACDRDLGPEAQDAMICSFECTFCLHCAKRMSGHCPNCRGELCRRPRRPASSLAANPPSTGRIFKPHLSKGVTS